ncbi:MAG: NADH-quinone oxidoreductase subunit L [Phycisphaerales bacterium JB037]
MIQSLGFQVADAVSRVLPAAAAGDSHGAGPIPAKIDTAGPWWVILIPGLPLLAFVLCGVFAAMKNKSKLPAYTVVGMLAASFALTLGMFLQLSGGTTVTTSWEWIHFAWGEGPGQSLAVDFGFYIDSLTCLWMLFVTGLATLIALYASEYMSHDRGLGYCRFFAAFALFVFSMACLVMGDNLVLLYLGWEGVGLCSYLLIGYFYTKPSAVAAAKKAFIMNRIGDLGLALGIMLTFVHFGTVSYAELFPLCQPYIDAVQEGRIGDIPFIVQMIPILLMIGAFGKSAQLPLYVWLPDAMEGPTPVSALIHAATMVTAGVYLIARTMPLFLMSEYALPIVAWVGGLTALVAATIGMAQFDIKRIMAYSTVSQLGYMFCGLAFLSSVGGAFHVLTHAFFKATLFLCCGAVMHGFAGQLDLRKLSGVSFMKGWGIVGIAMFVGCLNLAGFPFTAGFFSKDMILAEAFVTPGPGYAFLGWLLLLTAGLTAYYTFRVFFRVFVGPKLFEPGDELHDHDGHAHGEEHAHDPGEHGDHHHDHFHPHAPGWAINTVLALLAVASILAAGLYFVGDHGWVDGMIGDSTAAQVGGAAAFIETAHAGESSHGTLFGQDPHKIMYYISAAIGAVGILIAAFLHGPRGLGGLLIGSREKAEISRADALVKPLEPVAGWARRKWLVDEFYDLVVRKPLWILSHIFHLIDKLIVDGLVNLFGWIPQAIGRSLRPAQSGQLHGYAAGMAGGLAFAVLLIWLLTL